MTEPAEHPQQNFRITVAYDGRDYFGWQRHGDQPTVQLALEQALAQVVGVPVEVRGASRTDRGTHAAGQVVSTLLPAEIDPDATLSALNDVLPEAIEAIELTVAAADFHARTSATGKLYRYVIHNAVECPRELKGFGVARSGRAGRRCHARRAPGLHR